jgi:RNA polymerase sigma-70 factor (ECF subfamily)
MPESKPEELFKDWLQEHGGTILKIARAYTLTAEDRQDLVQEVLLQIWRSLTSYQGRAAGATWVYRVALNTALSWHRKEGKRRMRQEPLLEPEELVLAEPDSSIQLQQREILERLYAAIRQLPKTDAALVLLYLEDLSYRDMAEVLGISETNVGVKLARARKALAELIKETVYEPK